MNKFIYVLLSCVLCFFGSPAGAAPPEIRVELEPQVTVVLQGGVKLSLECAFPAPGVAQAVLSRIMSNPGDWRFFVDRSQARIPYARLNPTTQRRVLQALFPQDSVDSRGWRHVVTVDGPEGSESLFALAEWLTGRGTNASQFRQENGSPVADGPLRKGQALIMPYALLLPHMRPPAGGTPGAAVSTPPAAPEMAPAAGQQPKKSSGPPAASPAAPRPSDNPPPPPPVEEAATASDTTDDSTSQSSIDTPSPTRGNGLLTYGQDSSGKYAEYRLQPGESLYTAVVIRFTDIREHKEILKASETIARRSGIRDISRMPAGQRVKIPLDMLSAEYLPEDTPERKEFEEIQKKARELRSRTPKTRNLKGVVVVIDPGHGGTDPGTVDPPPITLYEDEVVYDIACRLKALLETRSSAKTYITMLDESQQYAPVSTRKFVNDTDEYVLVTPKYHNANAETSLDLRWALANHWYRQERNAGTPSEKIVFLSIHCDYLENTQVRGTTVYVPNAKKIGTIRTSNQSFRETKNVKPVTLSRAEAQTHEAMSRNFAAQIVAALKKSSPPIAILSHGDPIRNQIRREKGPFVPAVLKYNLIPTKVLVEIGNIKSPGDQALMSDPAWRQRYAEALYTALCRYFE